MSREIAHIEIGRIAVCGRTLLNKTAIVLGNAPEKKEMVCMDYH